MAIGEQTAEQTAEQNEGDEEKPVRFAVAVVCHTTSMMKQWQERIKQYVPAARIGLVQRDKLIVEDKDIVIMSVKTVANRDFSKHAFANIGMVIWDEIHLMCTRTFSQAFPKLATKYTLGLSATPYRKDQCEQIFQSFIGPVVYMRKRGQDERIEARCVTFLMEDIEITYNRFNKIQYTPTTVTTISREERNAWLSGLIAQLGCAGRTILVLSEYVQHLKTLQRLIDARRPCRLEPHLIRAFMMGCHPRLGKQSPLRQLPAEVAIMIAKRITRPVTTGLYIGALKNEDRKISEEKDIILGTYKLASVGMDIPALNTLVFASPRKEIEQSVGRILRKEHDRLKPLIVDVIDNHSLFKSQSAQRKKFYRTYGYTVVHQQVSADGTMKSTRRAPKTRKTKAAKKVEEENEEENEENEENEEKEGNDEKNDEWLGE